MFILDYYYVLFIHPIRFCHFTAMYTDASEEYNIDDEEEIGIGDPLRFDQLAQLFELDHYGRIHVSSSNVLLPAEHNRDNFESRQALERKSSHFEKQPNVYNILIDARLKFNTNNRSRTSSSDLLLYSSSTEHDHTVHLSNSSKNQERTDSQAGGDVRGNYIQSLNKDGRIDLPRSSNTSNYLVNGSARSYNSILINKYSKNMNLSTAQPEFNSSKIQMSSDMKNGSVKDENSNTSSLILKPSYNIFGRDYKFYDQLVETLRIKNNSAEDSIDLAIDDEDFPIVNQAKGKENRESEGIGNETYSAPKIHFVFVNEETSEMKKWKTRFLEEELKLIRLKQEYIQHKVIFCLFVELCIDHINIFIYKVYYNFHISST